MAKVFKDLAEPLKQLMSFQTKELTPLVTGFMIEELAEPQNGWVPYKKGDLTDSIFKASSIQEGIVGHSTPYAEDVWKKNVTGVAEWSKKYWEQHNERLIEEAVDNFKFK